MVRCFFTMKWLELRFAWGPTAGWINTYNTCIEQMKNMKSYDLVENDSSSTQIRNILFSLLFLFRVVSRLIACICWRPWEASHLSANGWWAVGLRLRLLSVSNHPPRILRLDSCHHLDLEKRTKNFIAYFLCSYMILVTSSNPS